MAMLDAVRKGFKSALNVFDGKREITEENIDEALKAIRMALFDADVNYRVVKDFLQKVKERAVGQIVRVSAKDERGERIRISPADAFVKICHDELEALMGPVDTAITFVPERLGPTLIMMVGLQGTGKTTTTAKLARWLEQKHNRKPLLVAADVYRPAAIDQLRVLGDRLAMPVYHEVGGEPVLIVERAIAQARKTGRDTVLIDTAGRLAVDDLLMTELEEIARRFTPHNILLVVDAMIGQDAVNTAREFNARLELDGFIMTKMDGDARGGAALSIKEVTGKPIKFIGLGEGVDALQEFQPSGFADRILGMGDIRSLVQRMENVIDKEEAKDREGDAMRMLSGEFDLYDFLEQIRMIKRMGSLNDLLEMMPFGSHLPEGLSVDDRELVRIEAMIQSMTPDERRTPEIITRQITRQRRIARGSGHKPEDVAELVHRFTMMRGMMSQFGGAQAGGLLSKIPGFKQLNQLRNLKNMDLGSIFGGGGMPGMPGMPGGFPGMPGMPGAGGAQRRPAAPPLPKGFTMPGTRPEADSATTRARVDLEKERRKKQNARIARKKNRR